MRICTKCGIEKPKASFGTKKDGRDGVRPECKTCVSERNRRRYIEVLSKDDAHKKRVAAYHKVWHQKNKAKNNDRVSANYRTQRELCVAKYGGKCACCGESRYEFLAIDHINGGGTGHRKVIGSKIVKWLNDNGFPSGFRVLCHNCNHAYGHHGFCPHQSAANGVGNKVRKRR